MKAWGWVPQTEEEAGGKVCDTPPGGPPPPMDPLPCPSRPASGGTDSRWTGSGKVMAPTSENLKASKKEPTPYQR